MIHHMIHHMIIVRKWLRIVGRYAWPLT